MNDTDSIDSIDRAVLAVDLGGTTLKGAVVDAAGQIKLTAHRTTPRTDVVDALVQLYGDLRSQAERQGYDIVGAGVVTPGAVDETTGVVAYASNLNWHDMPLGDRLHAALGVPVGVGHDVRSAGRIEGLIGAARGRSNFVHVTIGTGVAAALVAHGRAIEGALGIAGEFGHIPLVTDGEPCVCGQRGCLEVYVSGAGVARRYAAATGEQLSSRDVVARLDDDRVARQVWSDAIGALAQGLTIATLMLDPAQIVIGGGFSLAGEALLTPLRERVRVGLAWREPPEIALSTLGNTAGYLGAAWEAFHAAGLDHVVTDWRASLPVSSR